MLKENQTKPSHEPANAENEENLPSPLEKAIEMCDELSEEVIIVKIRMKGSGDMMS